MRTARLIGGAGTGKTSELLRLMEQVIQTGIVSGPDSIGFVSFTRVARQVAAERAAKQFKSSATRLQTKGWFRTLHSICFKCLGAKKDAMITDDAASRLWLAETLQDKDIHIPQPGEQDLVYDLPEQLSAAEQAITLWHMARNKLQPIEEAWQRAYLLTEHRFVGKHEALDYIQVYEDQKQEDGRLDFTDLLAQYAGITCTIEGYDYGQPLGEMPGLKVWFFDEQQDTSALLDHVCRRLIGSPTVEWVYTVGDPFQSIFGFAGADARHFMGWDVDKQRPMPKSWRCPRPILDLGEKILKPCADYFDRGIQPADHSGTVEICRSRQKAIDYVHEPGTWLVLARARILVRELQGSVHSTGIPWTDVSGSGGWAAPVRNRALRTLLALEQGAVITGHDWKAVLSASYSSSMKSGLPSKNKTHGVLLEHGTKKLFKDKEYPGQFNFVPPEQLGRLGATPLLIELILSGRWQDLIPGAEMFVNAMNKYGEREIQNPRIRVGTIHSAKGEEADNVILLVRSTRRVEKACVLDQTQESRDEERRLAYVGVTRARRRLILLCDPAMPYVLPIPVYGVTPSSRGGIRELAK